MWPLTFVFLFATAVPAQQPAAPAGGDYIAQVPRALNLQRKSLPPRGPSPYDANKNLCFTIRSYHFHRQDGLAPVPAGVTTCTPASQFRQRQVSPPPHVLYVPMGLQPASEGGPEK